MLSLETRPMLGDMKCHELITLVLYTSLAATVLWCVPRWLRSKLDTMFLKAVSRKAKEMRPKSMLCPVLPCDPGRNAAGPGGVLCSGQRQTEAVPDFYTNEGEDPDYMAVRDDGCGDYIVSRATNS